MSGIDDARDGEAEDAHNKLNEGLKSCRAVVSNYRALLDKKRAKKPAKDDKADAPAGDQGE